MILHEQNQEHTYLNISEHKYNFGDRMGKIKTMVRNALFLATLGLGGISAVGCASGRQENKGGWIGIELIENGNIKRTKISVGTGGGESIQMVLVEEPGGGKWIENNAGSIIYNWDPASRGWRAVSNPSVAINLKISVFAEEKFELDDFPTSTGTTKITTVKAGSDVYENATVVEGSNGTVLVYDKDGNKIFERDSKGQWYRVTSYVTAPVYMNIEY